MARPRSQRTSFKHEAIATDAATVCPSFARNYVVRLRIRRENEEEAGAGEAKE